MFLPLLVFACIGYVIFAIQGIRYESQQDESNDVDAMPPAIKYFVAGAVPLIVAGMMIYLFWVVGGATTVQFNAGSSSRMNAWGTWVSVWPIFLFLTATNSFGGLVWLIVCACRKRLRSQLGLAIYTLGLSCLAFLSVVSYFPSA